MITPYNAAADAPVLPAAMPRWPDLRHADLIERSLRQLPPVRREAMLDALALVLDRYLGATTQRVGSACADLDDELDEMLRRLGPTSAVASEGMTV